MLRRALRREPGEQCADGVAPRADTRTDWAATEGATGMADVLLEYPRPEIALLTLNRPHHLNALTSEMLDEIFATFERLGRDTACRVVVLTGAGRDFCAGAALGDYEP